MKIEYREFKTGEAVAEYYSADYIVAIVPIENGFGVFSKAVSIDSIKSMIWVYCQALVAYQMRMIMKIWQYSKLI